MDIKGIKHYLDTKVAEYERVEFIELDPISIPHRFSKLQDIEISAFIAATLAWGNRNSIIKSANRYMALMDDAPHDFILNHTERDLRNFDAFVHRTFNAQDAIFFVQQLQRIYQNHDSLEATFFPESGMTVYEGLAHFYQLFFYDAAPECRTRKHVSTPTKRSACKRLNMFLRWMVRQESQVDFGLWKRIAASDLMIPLDVHCGTVARSYGLLQRKQNDWQAVEALTTVLKSWDPQDPVKYDYALFSLGVMEKN